MPLGVRRILAYLFIFVAVGGLTSALLACVLSDDVSPVYAVRVFFAACLVGPGCVALALYVGRCSLSLSRAVVGVLTVLLGVPACVLFLFFGCGWSEGYCIIVPHIDTQFSEGYSVAKWDEVRQGMEKAEVLELLGKPLSDVEASPMEWWYSNDGKCGWADFAWEAKLVRFSADGLVLEKVQRWYFD